MSQFVLLVLRDGELPRCVGPFALQRSAESMVELEQLREGEYLIQPMEPPTARHRLIPSPVPRDLLCLSCGKPFLPTHSIAAPGPTSRHPFRTATGYRPSGSIKDDVISGVLADVPPIEERRHEYEGRFIPQEPTSAEGRAVAAGALADWEELKRKAREQRPIRPSLYTDLAAGGRPITSWVEAHADQLRRFVPQELPEPPKEIEP